MKGFFYLRTSHSLALMNLKTLRTLTFLFRYHGVSLACNMIRLFCCLLLTETEDGNLILGIERRGGTPEAKFLVLASLGSQPLP
jgi:hypothetical protein